jgi:hypothetical protein
MSPYFFHTTSRGGQRSDECLRQNKLALVEGFYRRNSFLRSQAKNSMAIDTAIWMVVLPVEPEVF